MATIKLTIIPAKKLKNGSHKIRIAICHKQVTSYIVTRFVIDSESQFKNGQVVKRNDAAIINTKLRNLLNLSSMVKYISHFFAIKPRIVPADAISIS